MAISHIKLDGTEKPLAEHLCEVAERAQCFAEKFDSGKCAQVAALLHDLGKFNEEFQKYIRKPEENRRRGEVNHSSPGAIWAVEKYNKLGEILAFLIAGHHAGLPDYNSPSRRSLKQRLKNDRSPWYENTMKNKQAGQFADRIPGIKKEDLPKFEENIEPSLWIRMLFSCLVDADFLATEAFFEPDKGVSRGNYQTLAELKTKFDSHMQKISQNAENTEINKIRNEIQKQCCEEGKKDNARLYTLTVPTGGGKTLASMYFAMEHAIAHKKDRIIYAIPFTSIIEQTVDVYRGILGNDSIVEHHSNIQHESNENSEDIKSIHYKQRLASENWDAPIVVTTNVQLFESLFAAKTSRCRKLHNIINSVIILDEAQMLPPGLLKPILQIIKQLSVRYRVTFVLCTATQPEFNLKIFENEGIKPIEICDKPNELAKKLKRVSIHVPKEVVVPCELGSIAEKLAEREQVLCIVNRKDDCLELYDELQNLTDNAACNIHLSTNMCGQHRVDKIKYMRELLAEKKPIRVVSTSLIEAGVDVDFPVVYRAGIGLDSIAQAAGRCNREGKMDRDGEVHIFVPARQLPQGIMSKGWDVAQAYITPEDDPNELLMPKTLKKYFRAYYRLIQLNEEIIEILKPCSLKFREAAEKFKFIDEVKTSVIVPYGNAMDVVEELRREEISIKDMMRRLQRFTVSVFERQLELMWDDNRIEDIKGIYVLEESEYYCEHIGLKN